MRPTLIELGPIPIRSYGVMVLLGFLLGMWYAMAVARRRLRDVGSRVSAVGKSQSPSPEPRTPNPDLITPDHVFDVGLVALFVSILGARLLYVLLSLPEFKNNPGGVFHIWEGGLSIHGAILFGALYLWWYCRRRNLSFLAFADIGAPAFALGYAVGRVGCFLNGCCYGFGCDLPWAVRFLQDTHTNAWTEPSHPTQLYATLMSLAIFFFLDRRSRRPHRDGAVFLGYLALYCVYRFIDEHFRKGATAGVIPSLGLTHAQVFSLLALPVLLFFLRRLLRAPGARSTTETVPS